MKHLVVCFLALVLAGCATTEFQNGDLSWKSRTLFKDINDVALEWDDVVLMLGGSATNETSALTIQEMAALMQFMYQKNTALE